MKTILLVEDTKVLLMIIKKKLTSRGYDVITAMDGNEALLRLQEYPDIQMVLSDWIMPECDGIELCQQVKSSKYSRYIFFILLSARDDQDSIIEGINAGADDFIAKDTDIEELDARLKAGFRTLALHNELVSKNTELDSAYATIKQDLEAAGEFIKRLLPSDPHFARAELNYVSIPSAQIGGDMLGCMQLDENNIGIYLFDVAGHGVSSALMSFSIQQSINVGTDNASLVRQKTDKPPYYKITSPCQVIQQLNELYLSQEGSDLYFTMVYAILNTQTGLLSYAFAGHPPLVWVQHSQEQAVFVEQDSYVVGVFDFADYTTRTIELTAGDKIWLYSDGITEAEKDRRQFSEARLKELIFEIREQPTSMQANTVINEVRQWQGKEQFDDDVSVLVFEWKGYPEGDEQCNTNSLKKTNTQYFK
ncbi:SpoIIE family protein phosphatase [uncultured Shewanella sp.]|uniref:PP2C family protein-serine/threonine phosphatase n=1 Tax=uncultured Shewanella sp. TaxID=173975 RepID=UPI0026148FAE|nr:SpoIIE family protein phosphatase [uncultured Shewanella sp.]